MDTTIVAIETNKPYNVIIGKGLVRSFGAMISKEIKPSRALIISDDTVMNLYGEVVSVSLQAEGFTVSTFSFTEGEKSKTPQTLFDILEFLALNGFDRSDLVIALGGGVTGDLAGLASAVYMRGMNLVQIPTTLLAMVDSSVGGKTGVNLTQGKNLAGVFKQPNLVICDTNILSSLNDEQFSCGMAEVIKYAMIRDQELFLDLISKKGRNALSDKELISIISRCVGIKGQIVSNDEFDKGERNLLNFGHTVGHAIEKCSGYYVNHGQAVAIGMALMTDVSEKLGLCESGTKEQLISVLNNFDLPSNTDIDAANIIQAMLKDKKREGNDINLVLPKKIGECTLKSFSIEEAERLIRMSLEG